MGQPECLVCGPHRAIPYRCSYCGGTYCPDHRLPEKHACDGVELLSPPEKRFRNKETGRIVNKGDPIKRPDPIEPKYTVGTRPEQEYESSPDVKLKSNEESGKPANKIEYRKWARPTIVVMAVILLGLINPMAAARASGSLLVLVIIWFVIKEYRPTWTAGWLGAWLFTLGLVTGIVNGVVGIQSTLNPVTAGLFVATILVLPAFSVWKLYDIVSANVTHTE